MTEKLQKTLRDSKTARWTALLIVSFTMAQKERVNKLKKRKQDILIPLIFR